MRAARMLVVLAGCAVVLGLAVSSPAGAADPNAMKEVGLTPAGEGTFSLDVQGADVRTVVRAISEYSGRNITVAEGVRGTVSVRLRNVGWREALRTVLRSSGLDFVEEGGILRVDQMTKLQTESVEREQARARQAELVPLDTRVIKLNYANATELAQALQASLSRRGSIQVEKRTNALIVNDLEDNVAKLEKMAIDLDATTPQIEITAKLVDVDAEALRDIGIEWNVAPQEPEFWSSVDTDGDGIDDGLPGGGPVHNDDYSVVGAGEGNTGIADPAAAFTFGVFKSWASIEAQLQVLEQNRKADIISNPRITTVDNREAKILVGQKIPLIIQDVAGNAVSQLQTIGVQLRVTPHLTQDKRIVMDLHPEVSDLSTQSTVQGGVIINTSEADTRVMVDDGQTAVIGGLIRSNTSNIRRGIPLLKDVPLVGFLFRSENNVRQNRELIIFVTPRIVTSFATNEGE